MGSTRTPSGRSAPLVAITILLTVFWFGLDRISGQLSSGSFIDRVITWVDQQSGGFPAPTDLMLKHYTRIPIVDRYLACGNIFLSNIISRSYPELSLYAIYGAGQLITTYIILVIEGLRDINGRNVVCLSTVWAMLIQLFPYANVMPLYGILHLSIISQAPAESSIVRLRDPTRLVAIIPALIPGFFLVTVLASLPFQGTLLRLLLNASFRFFPIHVAFWQFFATKILRRLAVGKYQGFTEAERDEIALKHVYDFTRTIAMLAQAVPLGVITVAQLFPGSFFDGAAEKLTFANVFLPSLRHRVEPWASAAEATHDFFIRNQLIGSAATIVWATTLFSLEHPIHRLGIHMLWGIVREIALAGPAGAVIWLLYKRDKEVIRAGFAYA